MATALHVDRASHSVPSRVRVARQRPLGSALSRITSPRAEPMPSDDGRIEIVSQLEFNEDSDIDDLPEGVLRAAVFRDGWIVRAVYWMWFNERGHNYLAVNAYRGRGADLAARRFSFPPIPAGDHVNLTETMVCPIAPAKMRRIGKQLGRTLMQIEPDTSPDQDAHLLRIAGDVLVAVAATAEREGPALRNEAHDVSRFICSLLPTGLGL